MKEELFKESLVNFGFGFIIEANIIEGDTK
jgi:hypothetical protein